MRMCPPTVFSQTRVIKSSLRMGCFLLWSLTRLLYGVAPSASRPAGWETGALKSLTLRRTGGGRELLTPLTRGFSGVALVFVRRQNRTQLL